MVDSLVMPIEYQALLLLAAAAANKSDSIGKLPQIEHPAIVEASVQNNYSSKFTQTKQDGQVNILKFFHPSICENE